GGSALLKVLRLAGKAAGIPTRIGPQVLRRTVNTSLLEAGVDGVILRAQMGHTSERMTSRYAGVHPEAKVAAIERLHAAVDGAGWSHLPVTPLVTPADQGVCAEGVRNEKAPEFRGLSAERETGLEPATFSLGIAMVAAVGWGL
ncbi:MAG: site-specific integrase, partial [Myxococcales bacterium]|nr:site-specific integrase [Myxococcales bacterium]